MFATALRDFPDRTHSNLRGALSPAFSPDGRYLACSYADGTVRLFEAETLTEIPPRENEPRHRDWATSVTFSPDGSLFVSTSDDDTLFLWKTDGKERIRVFEGHRDDVNDAIFSPDSRFVASVSSAGVLKIWSIYTDNQLPSIPAPEADSQQSAPQVAALDFSPDDAQIAVGRFDGTIDLYRLADLEHTQRFQAARPSIPRQAEAAQDSLPPPPSAAEIGTLSFGPGRVLASSYTASPTVQLWDTGAGRKLRDFELPCTANTGVNPLEVTSLAWSPTKPLLAVGGSDGCLVLFKTERAQPIYDFEGHNSAFRSLAFSPTGAMLASGDSTGEVRLWDVTRREHLPTATLHASPAANILWLAFSPDGRWLAGAGEAHATQLWDTRTHELVPDFGPDTSGLDALFFTEDGRRLILASDGKLSICSLVEPSFGATVVTLAGLPLHQAAANRAGTQLVLGARSGQLTIIDTSLEQRIEHWKAIALAESALADE